MVYVAQCLITNLVMSMEKRVLILWLENYQEDNWSSTLAGWAAWSKSSMALTIRDLKVIVYF